MEGERFALLSTMRCIFCLEGKASTPEHINPLSRGGAVVI